MSKKNKFTNLINVPFFVENILGNSHHKKRIGSISNAVLGVIESNSLILHRIGRGLARANNLSDKHAIKQIDRLLSNHNFSLSTSFHSLCRYMIGGKKAITVALDWTDFDKDNQTP
jgi:hypothetical protein